MIPEWIKIALVVMGICISRAGTIKYIKDIIAHKTKPHIYTRIIWFITQTIGILGIYKSGWWMGAWWPAIWLIGLSIVIALSFRHGTKDITAFDTALLVWWIIAIGLWFLIDNPIWSLIVVSCIDIVWYIPTIRKTRNDPYSETLIAWIGYCIANLCNIFALSTYNFNTLVYVGSIFASNLLMTTLILSKRRNVSKQYQ
jgi:hypothetical protein